MRIQIPDKETLQVRFPCHECETDLGGILLVDFKNITFDFKVERGELINFDIDGGDFFVEISDTLPTKKPSKEPHLTILPTFRLKDIFGTKIAKDLKIIVKDEDWENLIDLCVAYKNLNKKAIKTITSELIIKLALPIPKFEYDIEYHMAFFNCLNHIIEPWLNIDFDSFIQFLKSDVYNNHQVYFPKIQSFFSTNLNNENLDSLRVDCCDLIIRFIQNRENFFYIYKEDVTDDEYISNENFITLKNLYTDCFETLGKYAHLIFRLQNIIERGDEDSVPSDAPRDITDANSISHRSHGNKLEVLEKSNIPEFEKIYSQNTFDHRLRNGINHQKARLDKKKQIISYYPINNRPNQEFIMGYNDFLKNTLSSFSAIFCLSQLIIFSYINQDVH